MLAEVNTMIGHVVDDDNIRDNYEVILEGKEFPKEKYVIYGHAIRCCDASGCWVVLEDSSGDDVSVDIVTEDMCAYTYDGDFMGYVDINRTIDMYNSWNIHNLVSDPREWDFDLWLCRVWNGSNFKNIICE